MQVSVRGTVPLIGDLVKALLEFLRAPSAGGPVRRRPPGASRDAVRCRRPLLVLEDVPSLSSCGCSVHAEALPGTDRVGPTLPLHGRPRFEI